MDKDSLKLTKSNEDYLEAMYNLKKSRGIIRVKGIASILQVKPPSVVEALQKLSKTGLVSYEKYGDINLTLKGMEIAECVINKHEILNNFLTLLDVDRDTADEEACAMEHFLSFSTINKLKKFLEFIKRYPEDGNFLESFKLYKDHGKLPNKDKLQ
ncbi:MAG: metal-dependent transcriptional regulator [Euryarchaeota archaeon]|nr:metal-dependent transcriptional regulator [Euryarchaeota archaeon]